MSYMYICHDCGLKYAPETLAYKCQCGGLLDLEEFAFDFSQRDIVTNEWNLFRYMAALPFKGSSPVWREVSLGEGMTPLVPLDDQDQPNVLLKMEYLMPTLSFKDRGAVVVIAKAKEMGVEKVIQDSSGNAGNSIAAYASRAGILCDIYVPATTSPKKVKQIEAYGARVHLVPGTREDTARAALAAVEDGQGFYASHVYNPFFYQGTKTYAYEIYEQMQGDLPDSLIIPVGNGTLVLGAYYGFKELLERGLIDKLPKIIAVQTEGCPPIYNAFLEGRTSVDKVTNTGTLAEGIAVAEPMRGKQILAAIRATQGDIVLAPEGEIVGWREKLARKGLYVEPTTAATVAAFFQHRDKICPTGTEKVVIPLCGAGLKAD